MNADDVSPPNNTHPRSTLDHAMVAMTITQLEVQQQQLSADEAPCRREPAVPHTRVCGLGGSSA